MWMAFVARGFIPDGGRSRPETIECLCQMLHKCRFRAASQPIGDKSPHHRSVPQNTHQSSINTFANTIFGPFIFLMMIRRPSTSSTSSSSGTRFRVS